MQEQTCCGGKKQKVKLTREERAFKKSLKPFFKSIETPRPPHKAGDRDEKVEFDVNYMDDVHAMNLIHNPEDMSTATFPDSNKFAGPKQKLQGTAPI